MVAGSGQFPDKYSDGFPREGSLVSIAKPALLRLKAFVFHPSRKNASRTDAAHSMLRVRKFVLEEYLAFGHLTWDM